MYFRTSLRLMCALLKSQITSLVVSSKNSFHYYKNVSKRNEKIRPRKGNASKKVRKYMQCKWNGPSCFQMDIDDLMYHCDKAF